MNRLQLHAQAKIYAWTMYAVCDGALNLEASVLIRLPKSRDLGEQTAHVYCRCGSRLYEVERSCCDAEALEARRRRLLGIEIIQ